MSEAVAHIVTHEDDAAGRLLSQYRKPNVTALVRALASRTQAQEDALFELQAGQRLANAVGAQLDSIATLVGIKRGGLSDAQLRALVLAQIAKQCGNATRPTLLRIAQQLFETDDVHIISPTSLAHTPQRAGAVLRIGIGSSPLSKGDLRLRASLFVSAITGGVSVSQITHFQSANAFAFAGPQSWVKGFGEGRFASLVTVKEAV